MESIYDYRDYRDFVVNRFKQIKSRNRRFTYRYIAERLGIKSAGQVTSILNGSANLTKRTLPNMVELLDLREREKTYFKLLVDYNQTTAFNEKRELLNKLTKYTKSSAIKVNQNQYEFYQKWYYAAIRDLLDIIPFSGDYKMLAKCLTPNITPLEARRSIALLRKLELIQEDENGVFRPTSNIIQVKPTDESSVILSGYADEMIGQARNALNNFPRNERTIAWAGFSVSNECYEVIKEEIREFRNKILDIVAKDKNPERVFQLNIQSFPVSKDLKGRNK